MLGSRPLYEDKLEQAGAEKPERRVQVWLCSGPPGDLGSSPEW